MFWKKKEVKEPTKLYKRIEKLYGKMKDIFPEARALFGTSFVKKEFLSNLGERIFRIIKDTRKCEYGTILDTYYTVYFSEMDNSKDYIVPRENDIFKLEVYENETILSPCPTPLSAHEIDLAILEFENYIDKIYKEHMAKIKELEN